jgi:hypothetical protein
MLDANSGLSPSDIKNIIADTAVPRGDKSTTDGSGRPKNFDFGWGELDAFAAVAVAVGLSEYTPTPFPVELYQNPTIADGAFWDYEFEVTDPNTPISVNIFSGGVWTTSPYNLGQDFDAWLYSPSGAMIDESTCSADSDTQCGDIGRQETLVADPADFGGNNLPLGTWRLRVEPWSDTDGQEEESAEVIITLGPLSSEAPTPPPAGDNEPPVANFTFTTTNLTANFTDTSSDGDGSVIAWSWSFGDGTTSSTQNPSRAYTSADTYAVKLVVTDNDGAQAETTKEVTVSAPETALPDAKNDSGSIASGWRNREVIVTVLANDSDPYGGGLTVTSTGVAAKLQQYRDLSAQLDLLVGLRINRLHHPRRPGRDGHGPGPDCHR